MAKKKSVGDKICAQTPSGAKVCIRDARYDQPMRLSKWNIDPTPLQAADGQAARRAFPAMSKADHEAIARHYAAAANEVSTKHSKAIDAALKRHGLRGLFGEGAPSGESSGPLISGVYSDKFDAVTKDKLRDLAHTASRLRSASVLHWAGTGKRTPWRTALGNN